MQNRRTERGTFFPPFWKMDSHYVLVEFSKKIDLQAQETIVLNVEGRYSVKLDGKLLFGSPEKVTIPAGKHSLNIKVHNQSTVPAIFVYGTTIWQSIGHCIRNGLSERCVMEFQFSGRIAIAV